jgi:hypothetical protein
MKSVMSAALPQCRSKQLFVLLTVAVVVFLIIYLVSPRTEIYNYYQQSWNPQKGTYEALVKSNVPALNRKYNLMDEVDAVGKLNQLFGYDSSECNEG